MLFNFIPRELDHLRMSKFDFFLTGSRFFKRTAQEDTDWDFYTQDCAEVQLYLKQNGYVVSHKYEDSFTVAVMTRETRGLKIDIQLVGDVGLKTKAQEMLRPFINRVPKEHHKVLWDMSFEWLKSN